MDCAPTDERVTAKELQDLAASFECPVWEVSALTGQNIEESIKSIVREVRRNRENQYFLSGEKTKKQELHDPKIPTTLEARNQACLGTSLVPSIGFS